MTRLLAFATLLLSCCPSNAADATPPDDVRAREWVRNLGDARFRVRDSAAKELMKLGRLAKPALLEGMKSSDPEVWQRCNQLLPQVLAEDLKARVDAFLADSEGKKKHDLPLWAHFEKTIGADAVSRKLFADMLKNNAEFFEACEMEPNRAAEKCANRCQEMFQNLNNPRPSQPRLSAGDLGAMFLVGSNPEMAKGAATATGGNINAIVNFLWQPEFQNALKTGDAAVPYRKLFFAWADQRRVSDENSVMQVLSVIQNTNLKEGIDYATKVMKSKDHQVWARAQAMSCVGKMGGKDQMAAFESIFDDKTQITTIQLNELNIKTQVNDVALAMAVQLSGQTPKDYGFDALQSQPALLWQYHYLGFTTEEKRTAAFKKYADWSAAQKKK